MVLAIAYDLNGQNEDAYDEYQRAVELSPSNSIAGIGIGLSLANLGRPDEGIPYIERGLQLNPQDPRNHIYFGFMARAQFTARRYDAAIDWARKAVQRRPNAPEPHINLAVSLGHLGKNEAARAEFEIAERLRPGFAKPSEWQHTYTHSSDNQHFLDGLRKAGWRG